MGHGRRETNYSWVRAHMESMKTMEGRNELQPHVASLNSNQKSVFDDIIPTPNSRRDQDTKRFNVHLFILKGRARPGNTCNWHQVQKWMESELHIVLFTATTENAVLLFEGGRSVHSLQRLGIDGKAALIIVLYASIVSEKKFEVFDEALKDLRCSSRVDLRPEFGELCILIAGDYFQLLPMLSSRHWVQDEDAHERFANLCPLYEVYTASRVRSHVKVLITKHIFDGATTRRSRSCCQG